MRTGLAQRLRQASQADVAALLVAIAALSDGRKVVVAVTPGYRESTESWSDVLRELRGRGMNAPKLVIGDGHLGIWGALTNVYPEADEQGCWNHKIINALDKVPKKQQAQATLLLRQIPYTPTREEAEQAKATFQRWCRKHSFSDAAAVLDRHWERMVTFYRFPKAHWKHLRTSNPVESPFATVRLRTNAAKRFKKVDNATAMTWKILLVAEERFRRLDAPHLMKEVFLGTTYLNGESVKEETGRKAA